MDKRNLTKREKQCVGRISTLKRMMKKREEWIINYRLEIYSLKKEMEIKQKEYKKILKTQNINPYIEYKRKGKYWYWIGFVRWFGRVEEFQLGNDKKYQNKIKNNKGKNVWYGEIRRRFVERLTETQLEGYIREL